MKWGNNTSVKCIKYRQSEKGRRQFRTQTKHRTVLIEFPGETQRKKRWLLCGYLIISGDLKDPYIKTSGNWFKCILFKGWVILHCVYVPQLSYPFICWWTSRLLPCPGYYKQCCDEHWGIRVSFNSGFLSVYAQAVGLLDHKAVLFPVVKLEWEQKKK